MKPAVLSYIRPDTLDEAVGHMAVEDAVAISGGQSLVPLLNLRLARPGILVDVARLAELRHIETQDQELVIGAAVTQAELQNAPLITQSCALIPMALHYVGHAQIRARGTIGGSLAHADPCAELPCVVVALGATLVVRGLHGTRRIPAEEFFLGPYTTALDGNELLVEIRIPVRERRYAFCEFSRRHGDFALASVALASGSAVDRPDFALAVSGVGRIPRRLAATERLLSGGAEASDAADAATHEVSRLTESPDEYTCRLVGALVHEAVEELPI